MSHREPTINHTQLMSMSGWYSPWANRAMDGKSAAAVRWWAANVQNMASTMAIRPLLMMIHQSSAASQLLSGSVANTAPTAISCGSVKTVKKAEVHRKSD
jgi:hypothetical protein